MHQSTWNTLRTKTKTRIGHSIRNSLWLTISDNITTIERKVDGKLGRENPFAVHE